MISKRQLLWYALLKVLKLTFKNFKCYMLIFLDTLSQHHTKPAEKKIKDILKVWQGTLVSKLDPSSPKKLGYSAYP